MSVSGCSDYYQLCYTVETPPKEKDVLLNGVFPYEHYISSPKTYHRHSYDDKQDIYSDKENVYSDKTEEGPISPGSVLYSDLDAIKTMLQSSYRSERIKKDKDLKERNCDKSFVQEAVSCLESLLSNGEEESCFKVPEIIKKSSGSSCSSDSAFSNSSCIETINCDEENNNIDNVICNSASDEQNIPDTRKMDLGVIADHRANSPDGCSSSGVSSNSDSPSTSCNLLNSPDSEINSPQLLLPSELNKLNIEIDRLKNIKIKYSPEINKCHSVPKVISDNVCEDINLLELKSKSECPNTNNQSSAPNDKKSPLFDMFKSKRNVDYEVSGYGKQKNRKQSRCLSRSNSALFCNFRRTQTCTIKSNSKYMNLTEKHDAENRTDDDINSDMKLQHPSPFVRTIFQYVETTSVEDIFSVSNFSVNDNSIPLFTSGGMHIFQDNKFNSIPRKVKKNSIIRTLEREQHELTLVPSGRRISETSDFYISIIAYLDRVRKAKVVPSFFLTRRPRQRRHKSDPGDSLSFFLKNNSEKSQLKDKRNNSSEELHDVSTAMSQSDKFGSLNKRFSDLELNSESKHFKSVFSSSDSAIHHKVSLFDDPGDHRKPFSRKSKSLRNISGRKKCVNGPTKHETFDMCRLSFYEDTNDIMESQSNETDLKYDRLHLARKDLFPKEEKQSPLQRTFLENCDIQRLPNRRSVFSENFDSSWCHSVSSTSTPIEIQTMLDTRLLSPEDRQLLTDLLLLQLTKMGPTNSDQDGIHGNEHAPSTGDFISASTSENSNTSSHPMPNFIEDDYKHDFVKLKDQTGVCDFDYNQDQTVEIDEHDPNFTSSGREKDYIKKNKPRKLFGSMKKNKSKLIDWDQVQYMNVGYDGDSMQRKGKGINTKHCHIAPKVKRFSALRSIFEPITNPKVKKPWKLDRTKTADKNTKMKVNLDECEEFYTVCKKDDKNLKVVSAINHNMEVEAIEEKTFKKDVILRDLHGQEDASLTSCCLQKESHLSNYSMKDQHKLCRTYRPCYNNFSRKPFRKSRSIDSINVHVEIKNCHRKSLSRSADDIYELKECSRYAATLFHTANDSGILYGSDNFASSTVSHPRKDSNEAYVANGGNTDLGESTTSQQHQCQCHVTTQDAENSKIVVEVPHHLIPPEITSKSPHQSPIVRRKGLLKRTPCILQDSLSYGERGRDFTSADSGLSLSDETDYTQPCDKDVANYCVVKEPRHTLTVNLKHPVGSSCKNSLHKTEIFHHVDEPKLPCNNKSIPHVINYSRSFNSNTVCRKNGNHDLQSNDSRDDIRPNVIAKAVKYGNFSVSNIKKENNEVELEFKTPSSTCSLAKVVSSKEPSKDLDDEDEANSSNSGELPLTRKPSVIWAIVKKMEVSLVIQRDYGDPDVIKIEDFNVRRVNTYKDVEELAVDTFMKHLQLLDKQHLNLDTYDIKYLQMAEHRVPLGSPFDLSLVKVDDAFLPCRLCMKDKESWSLASLSYDSLIPKSYLEKYLSLILSHHHGVFFGPSGTGKSYLAERISNLINYRMNEGTIPPIILKNATPERWKTLLSNLCTDKKEKPFVIILDGFSQRFIESNIDIGDIIKVCDKLDPKPYIICTLTITPYIEIPPKWQLNFKWIWLSNHEEPVDGLLQRYLRRKFIQFGNQHLQREFFRIADWLTSVWRHINSFLKKFTSSDCSIGPTMFYECPSDILEAEEWFVDLWNYSITPYILTTVKEGLKLHSTRSEWEDPLAFILKSYPWVSEKMKRKMKLKRICKEDVDYSMHCHSEEEKQRLLDFLRQLEIMMFANVDQRKETVSKRYTLESFL